MGTRAWIVFDVLRGIPGAVAMVERCGNGPQPAETELSPTVPQQPAVIEGHIRWAGRRPRWLLVEQANPIAARTFSKCCCSISPLRRLAVQLSLQPGLVPTPRQRPAQAQILLPPQQLAHPRLRHAPGPSHLSLASAFLIGQPLHLFDLCHAQSFRGGRHPARPALAPSDSLPPDCTCPFTRTVSVVGRRAQILGRTYPDH